MQVVKRLLQKAKDDKVLQFRYCARFLPCTRICKADKAAIAEASKSLISDEFNCGELFYEAVIVLCQHFLCKAPLLLSSHFACAPVKCEGCFSRLLMFLGRMGRCPRKARYCVTSSCATTQWHAESSSAVTISARLRAK
jgi:hypothetical protein